MTSYIKELLDKLNAVEIYQGAAVRIKDYDSGLQFLLEEFTAHKKAKSQVFFIGNGGSAAIASHMTADFMKNGGMNTYAMRRNRSSIMSFMYIHWRNAHGRCWKTACFAENAS